MEKFIKDYPELFHYTTAAGLDGILRSQRLRFTHASYLNDSSEISSFKDRSKQVLLAPVTNSVRKICDKSTSIKANIEIQGGIEKVAEDILNEMVGHMYWMFEKDGEADAFAEPYVFSFSHTKDPFVSEHGKLSQWRGYGADGGYALIFDNAQLSSLFVKAGAGEKCTLFAGNVVYSNTTDEELRKEFGDVFDRFQDSIQSFLETIGDRTALESIYDPLLSCTCRYKHWGFYEEEEVRCVAVPNSQKVIDAARNAGHPAETLPREYYLRGGTFVPCVYLLGDICNRESTPLPVKRIIVGPHRDKLQRKHSVENFLKSLGLNIPVTVSEIPLVEPPR